MGAVVMREGGEYHDEAERLGERLYRERLKECLWPGTSIWSIDQRALRAPCSGALGCEGPILSTDRSDRAESWRMGCGLWSGIGQWTLEVDD